MCLETTFLVLTFDMARCNLGAGHWFLGVRMTVTGVTMVAAAEGFELSLGELRL